MSEVRETYPSNDDIDLEELADMISTVIEAGIIMSKVLNDPQKLPEQVVPRCSGINCFLALEQFDA
ncbi:MAG: hypothetical protein V7723_00935 [Sneathiella sp.]|uniref:hypothetical protein n=1 Tax=Sneathiella sp. TaxID=1964365 RepID=UPI0030010CB1